MSSVCKRIQNIPCNRTDLLTHFLAIFFSVNCSKHLLHQRNSIKPLTFFLIKTSHFKPRFFRKGFHHMCLLLVRTLWHNFGYFVQQIFRICIINDRIFFLQEKLRKFRDIWISLQSGKSLYFRDEFWSRACFVSHT